jgi:acetyltransferase-like isoleucine patch superfamily enzyme
MVDRDLSKVPATELQRLIYLTPFIYGPQRNLTLEEPVYLVNATINLSCGKVSIGRGTFCGHNVCILTGSHDLDLPGRPRAVQGRDIVIGRDVWLCSNATVLGPSKIGDRCVIAAGAVVAPRTECEPGWVYAGVPAKKLRPAIEVRANNGIGPLLLMDLRPKKKKKKKKK